jgi:putative addiction module killer protein
MHKIKQTVKFSSWISKLKDIKGRVSILRRIERLKKGNFGDYKSLGESTLELRIKSGPGYRVYYTKKDDVFIILLIAGDKSTQVEDIKKAKEMAKEYNEK